jgi:hypothetical protein
VLYTKLRHSLILQNERDSTPAIIITRLQIKMKQPNRNPENLVNLSATLNYYLCRPKVRRHQIRYGCQF